MNALSWANWQRLSRLVMVVCLIQALLYGSAWYVDQQTPEARVDKPATVEAPQHAAPAPPEHPVIRKPLEERQMPLFTVCDYDMPDKYDYGTEEHLQAIRESKCQGREPWVRAGSPGGKSPDL
jgi:hypothetical protein